MSTQKILAFDLGAESGRGLVGAFDGERLTLEVVHRFPNGGVPTLDTLHWDVLGLCREMLTGLHKAHAEHGPLASVGVDTWGVDFAFLGKDGGKARGMCDFEFIIPSNLPHRIQEGHQILYHSLCEWVDEKVD